jgi:hypothetical protein
MNLLSVPLINVLYPKLNLKNHRNLKLRLQMEIWSLLTIVNRHKLYLKKQKAPFDLILKKHYIKYRNLLNSLNRKYRSIYYKKQFYLSKNNIKNTWKLINEATYSNKKEETPIYRIESSSKKSFLSDKTTF